MSHALKQFSPLVGAAGEHGAGAGQGLQAVHHEGARNLHSNICWLISDSKQHLQVLFSKYIFLIHQVESMAMLIDTLQSFQAVFHKRSISTV